ncbi:MAG: hypothetical protein RIA64_12785 [Rhodospirillales bacterium]
MGYSVEMMALFQTMHNQGLFENIEKVVDLGSQEMHFSKADTSSHPHREAIRTALKTMGRVSLTDTELEAMADRAPTRDFFKRLNLGYKALDADGWYGDPFDLNLDKVRDEDAGAYCLSINCGTTEHLIDQCNAFKIIHDLTRPGGLMIHALPFLGSIDHGFFNYNPNLFWALARFNSYEMIGLWVNPAGSASLIPWSMDMVRHLNIPTTPGQGGISVWCLMRKEQALEFCPPFQSGYEAAQAESNLARYNYAVDGRLMAGTDVYRITQSQQSLATLPGRVLLNELKHRIKRRLGLGG